MLQRWQTHRLLDHIGPLGGNPVLRVLLEEPAQVLQRRGERTAHLRMGEERGESQRNPQNVHPDQAPVLVTPSPCGRFSC